MGLLPPCKPVGPRRLVCGLRALDPTPFANEGTILLAHVTAPPHAFSTRCLHNMHILASNRTPSLVHTQHNASHMNGCA